MKVAGKDINEWADAITDKRKELEKLPPREQKRAEENPIHDRWQAEADSLQESDETEDK